MVQQKRLEFLETIEHSTDTRPFLIHHTTVQPSDMIVLYRHWHPEVELFYLEEGEAILLIEEEQYLLKAGEAIFIPPYLLHSAIKEKSDGQKCSFSAIVFSTDMICGLSEGTYYEKYIQPVIYNNLHCVIHLENSECWKKAVLEDIKSLLKETVTDISSYELTLRGYLLMIWQQMYNHCFKENRVSRRFEELYQRIYKAVEYMKTHYMDDINLKQLAELSCLSEGQFCRTFKRITGFSAFNYLNRIRIMRSCDLLIETNKTIAEIAGLSGYNNISYYNREFIKLMKETPSSYRRYNL